MTERQKKSLRDIAGAMSSKNDVRQDVAAGSIKDLLTAVYSEPDPKKRKKLMADFSARHADAADFLAENEDLINAEAEAALICAAVGGTYTDTEVSYKGGRKHVTVKNKRVLPNAAALNMLLKNRMPDKYSDHPTGEIEIEDTSEINEVIDRENEDTKNGGEENHTV